MFRIFKISLFLSLILSLAACSGRKQCATVPNAEDSISFKYASFIHIYKGKGYQLAVLDNPWRRGQVLHRYILVPRGASMPDSLPQGTVLRTPLQRLAVGSSVHCSLLSELQSVQTIRAVCDSRYILLPKIQNLIRDDSVTDLGTSQNPDIEKLLAARCDAFLLSPYDGVSYGSVEAAGVPVVECADYMETSPLGRAEWMRFYGLLVGQGRVADSLFAVVEKNYLALKRQACAAREHPTLFTDLLTSAVWYQPGGKSTMGQLFSDAGATYLWADNHQSGSLCLSLETVLQKAANAQFWLIKYGAARDLTYSSLQREQKVYSRFSAFRSRNVWGCNLFHVPFFETGSFHPDYVLHDLINILHPGLLPDSRLKYFQPLKN